MEGHSEDNVRFQCHVCGSWMSEDMVELHQFYYFLCPPIARQKLFRDFGYRHQWGSE